MTASEQQTQRRQTVQSGTVKRVSGTDSISVETSTLVKHPRYGKYIQHRTRLLVHDPGNQARVGDLVEITPCRRVSKGKSWRLARVVRSTSIG